ncbi:hypothetical protein [Candidatus Berkiella aquae]|uniref:Uncharacterized protein n=1 Tax=Candidatus Berkiella aquae TaxID=295108 RepID=A0A0Q9YY74_9GAMM|nr:hypothetical protein [Candidatus Berkiella aquae]MCS5711225.1 hypothetical protein [Candidatus Berkiella aquae]
MHSADQQMLEILKVYEHHITQFDRLMHVIDTLKLENKRLRECLMNQVCDKQPAKPRVVCRPLV